MEDNDKKSLNYKQENKNKYEDMHKYRNVYFITGTAYAGKSTMAKLLSEKYNGIHCEENYHDRLSDKLDKTEFPGLCYTRDLKDWRHFIRRTPDEYANWISVTNKECEKLELIILEDLIKENKKIFVDTNISVETLMKISDKDHVLIMLADPYISVNRFFERPDREKQFLYKLLMNEENPEKALENFKKCLEKINNEEEYNRFLNCGFNVIIRDESRSIDDTLKLVEKLFKLRK